MLSLGAVTKMTGQSLLGRSVLGFLDLRLLTILRLRHPMSFFPSNNQYPSPEPFLRFPMANVSSIPNTIYMYSSLTPLVQP